MVVLLTLQNCLVPVRYDILPVHYKRSSAHISRSHLQLSTHTKLMSFPVFVLSGCCTVVIIVTINHNCTFLATPPTINSNKIPQTAIRSNKIQRRVARGTNCQLHRLQSYRNAYVTRSNTQTIENARQLFRHLRMDIGSHCCFIIWFLWSAH